MEITIPKINPSIPAIPVALAVLGFSLDQTANKIKPAIGIRNPNITKPISTFSSCTEVGC